MGKVLKVLFTAMFLCMLSAVALAAGVLFKPGDHQPEIANIQAELRQKGYTFVKISGVYDPATVRAVREFQKKQGGSLPCSGNVDDNTYFKLMGKKYSLKNNTGLATRITATAQRYIGVPYQMGGTTPKGFDCSGFVWYVFHKNGAQLPRTADVQYQVGKNVPKKNLQRGDLVFFTTYEPGASHCGIYLEDGRFIHASSSKGIMISKLDDMYWKPRYFGAKRVIA